MNTLNIHQKTKKVRNYLLWYVVGLLILASFTLGLFLGRTQNVLSNYAQNQAIEQGVSNKYTDKSKKADFDLFWQVWDIVEKKFVKKPLDYHKMVYGAIAGLVASLEDPYSVFMDPEITKKFKDEIEGTFEGIGAEVGMKNNRITIIAPISGSPADRAGLRPHDLILKIDNEDTSAMSLHEAVAKIRGKEGSEVTLAIMRKGFTEPKDFKIKREKIDVKSATLKKIKIDDKKIAYIKLSHFSQTTAADLRNISSEILKEGEIKGIILDLRNNSGGYLESSIDVLSIFIKEGELVAIQEAGNGTKKEYKTRGKAMLSDFPLVVIVNSGSASASEIVAGALRDVKAAPLVGEKTFGKGSVQEYEAFADGSSLRLSVAKWLTPKGVNINGEGILPEIEVKLTDEDYEADRDPQMESAKEKLKQMIK